jgi:hypothetical protein
MRDEGKGMRCQGEGTRGQGSGAGLLSFDRAFIFSLAPGPSPSSLMLCKPVALALALKCGHINTQDARGSLERSCMGDDLRDVFALDLF